VTGLSAADRATIARARELAGLPADGNTGYTGQDNPDLARAEVLGEAQHLLRELAGLAGRLAAATGDDARRLAEIRDLLAHFDWEYHDRQLALEAIERIVEGGAR
jgi:hypothetical protein